MRAKRYVKRIVLAICMVCGLGIIEASAVSDDVLYISTAGNDAWSGTLDVPNAKRSDGPLATLKKAQSVVRGIIAKGPSQPVEVQIRGGEYILESTVVFGPEDAGTKACPITYRAYPGEKPVFTGARKLTDWKPCTKDPAGLPAVAKGKLWTAEIPKALKGKWQIKTLYDGQTLLPRARSEIFKTAQVPYVEDYNCQPKEYMRKLTPDMPAVKFSREMHYQNDDMRAWSNPRDIEIFLSPTHRWLINMLPLERIDTGSKTAWFAVDPTYMLTGHQPKSGKMGASNKYQIENAIDHLDQAGEWVFNSNEGRIYMWPTQTLASADIRAPYLQEFILVEGIEDKTPVRYVNFEGLTFHHGLRETWQVGDKGLQHDWEMYDKGNAILRFRHAEDCSVKSSVFSASSGGGVRLDLHCQRITVDSSVFAYLGGTGILLSGYAPGTKDENKNNTISNNYIHHVGQIYLHAPGIFITQSGHNLISHNTIHDLHYNGMVISGCRPHELYLAKPLANRREWGSSLRMDECQPFIDKAIAQRKITSIEIYAPLLHARENLITDNEIYRTMLTLGDGNGIYFSAMGISNRVERNYLHDIDHSAGSMRLDDNSLYTIINNNVMRDGNYAFEIKGPMEVNHNFFINMKLIMGRNFNLFKGGQNVLFSDQPGNKFYLGRSRNRETGKFKKVPVYKEFTSWDSILFAAKAPDGVTPGQDLIPAEQRGKSEVGMLYTDPMFDKDAMKHKIFRFLPGSPAAKLGIKPLDMSKVGSTLAEKQ